MNDLARAKLLVDRIHVLMDGTSAEDVARLIETAIAGDDVYLPLGRAVPGGDWKRALSSARITVEHLGNPESVIERPEGLVDLGVISWMLRPALRIAGGILQDAGDSWRGLSSLDLTKLSASVCKICLAASERNYVQVGSGFCVRGVVEDSTTSVLTSAHVIEQAHYLAARYAIPERVVACFADDGECEVCLAEIEPLASHLNYDLSVCAVRSALSDDIGVALETDAESTARGQQVCVVGFPSLNTMTDDPILAVGFAGAYGVKRLSPGIIRDVAERNWRGVRAPVVLHDCTTLDGSSGSCVVSRETGAVVAVHFGGWPQRKIDGDGRALFEANGAVPFSALAGPWLR